MFNLQVYFRQLSVSNYTMIHKKTATLLRNINGKFFVVGVLQFTRLVLLEAGINEYSTEQL